MKRTRAQAVLQFIGAQHTVLGEIFRDQVERRLVELEIEAVQIWLWRHKHIAMFLTQDESCAGWQEFFAACQAIDRRALGPGGERQAERTDFAKHPFAANGVGADEQ